jgi:cytochrome bd-type quinol oxidase subunit 2
MSMYCLCLYWIIFVLIGFVLFLFNFMSMFNMGHGSFAPREGCRKNNLTRGLASMRLLRSVSG